MRGRLFLVGALVSLIWLGAAPSGQQPDPGGARAVENELLVRFHAGLSEASGHITVCLAPPWAATAGDRDVRANGRSQHYDHQPSFCSLTSQ